MERTGRVEKGRQCAVELWGSGLRIRLLIHNARSELTKNSDDISMSPLSVA